jgi:ATP-binding cassette, subfamily A (ABC1), member 3
VSIRNLNKTYRPPLFSRKRPVTAVSDLSLDIPRHGITVLLGSNGAGKSTTLGVLAGLLSSSSGEVLFDGSPKRPGRGQLGIVPQKNVLFEELTCLQNLRIWSAVKARENEREELGELEELLRECDLGKKIHARAGTLSGGQKRKLQLAVGLVGGSQSTSVF